MKNLILRNSSFLKKLLKKIGCLSNTYFKIWPEACSKRDTIDPLKSSFRNFQRGLCFFLHEWIYKFFQRFHFKFVERFPRISSREPWSHFLWIFAGLLQWSVHLSDLVTPLWNLWGLLMVVLWKISQETFQGISPWISGRILPRTSQEFLSVIPLRSSHYIRNSSKCSNWKPCKKLSFRISYRDCSTSFFKHSSWVYCRDSWRISSGISSLTLPEFSFYKFLEVFFSEIVLGILQNFSMIIIGYNTRNCFINCQTGKYFRKL